MDRAKKLIQATEKDRYPYSGKGVVIAVLDSGISMHPDLWGRIIGFQDFVSGYRRPYDDNGHGTHVVGCICGRGACMQKYAGVAPGCHILACKVLDQEGEGDAQNMLAAMEWCIRTGKMYGTKIVSLSVGVNREGKENHLLTESLEQAWKAGMLPVVAAGNQGPKAGSMSVLGNGEHVIAVGCMDGEIQGEDGLFCEEYSGRGWEESRIRKPDILAPGNHIVSCCAQFRRRRNGSYFDAYVSMSGTSMAVPLVSAAAALLWEKYPEHTNAQIRQMLLKSARDLGKPWNYQGWGLLDVKSLLEQ